MYTISHFIQHTLATLMFLFRDTELYNKTETDAESGEVLGHSASFLVYTYFHILIEESLWVNESFF